MVIGSIGDKQKERTTMRSRRIGTRTSGAMARPGRSKAAAREHDAVQQEAASTAAPLRQRVPEPSWQRRGNTGQREYWGKWTKREDLVEREDKGGVGGFQKGQKGTKGGYQKGRKKEEREEKQEVTEAKDRREVASSVVGLTTPGNART